jgi:hypothetical protein
MPGQKPSHLCDVGGLDDRPEPEKMRIHLFAKVSKRLKLRRPKPGKPIAGCVSHQSDISQADIIEKRIASRINRTNADFDLSHPVPNLRNRQFPDGHGAVVDD